MEQSTLITSILTAVLTGGVLVLFIENQHVTSFVWTKYESIMTPFLHKLTCIIQYISKCNSAIESEGKPDATLIAYKKRLNYFRTLNHVTIMGGRDIPLDYLSANKLDEVCNKVNDIWYYGNRNQASMKDKYIVNNAVYDDSTKKHLAEIFHDIPFSQKQLTIQHLNEVTGTFYTEIYQPIKDIPLYYEMWNDNSSSLKELSIACIAICILGLILMMLWPDIPICCLIIITILSILLFCGTLFYLMQVDNLSRKMFR